MKLFLKGILIGIGKIIPGVSGGIIAISLGVYEKGLESLNHPFKNFAFLFPISLGILISVLFISKIIDFSLREYYFQAMMLFIGLIAGGLPMLFDKIENQYKLSNLFYLLLGVLIILSITYFSSTITIKTTNNNFVFWLIMGLIDSFTMIVPGVSGTAILSLFGAYKPLISALSLIKVSILFPFILGLIIGTIILIKVIAFLFKNYNIKMYFVIIGLATCSTVVLVLQVMSQKLDFYSFLVGLFLFVIGYILGNKLEE